ncbi:MAG: hypothetical protein JWL59_4344 [Chthoniobacteraceae bacterium]|nr:hypothetical protein [Chthoniobacteraceae bacterium]
MTSTKNDEGLLETDSRGRVIVSKERREALLDEYEKSGLSGARFARLVGVRYTTFVYWRQSRRKTRAKKCDSGSSAADRLPEGRASRFPVHLLEASLENTDPALPFREPMQAGLTVELPGGARLQIESPSQLALAAELIALTKEPRRRPC